MRPSILVALLPAIAAAGPILEARSSNEGVYLTNCKEFEPGELYSELDYYSNAKQDSQNQQQPDATAVVGSPSGQPNTDSRVHWEGNQICGFFSASGETFCSNIESNAASYVR